MSHPFCVILYYNFSPNADPKHGWMGIATGTREEGARHFRGKCFVFNDRLVVPVIPSTIDRHRK